jgi:NB-ARC domain
MRSNTSRNLGGESNGGSPGYMPFFADSPADREDPHLPCHLMPLARNKGFFGRKEILEDLENALLPTKGDGYSGIGQAALKSFAICGPGGMKPAPLPQYRRSLLILLYLGIGKTQIAVEYIHSRKDYYDAILWVQADEHAKLAQGFYHIAINLGLVKEHTADARDHVITREAVKSWLKDPVKSYTLGKAHEPELATWVLVFDNLDDLNILNDFWPFDSPGSVIITSRDPLSKTYPAGRGAKVDAFNPEEATEFLLKLTHREEEVEERPSGNIVAARLGGLPLALTQMAGVITRRDLSFSEFLQVYDEESSHKDLFNLHFPYASDGSGYQHTLASVWALETLNESTTLLDILSLLDSDGIQERILEDPRGDTSLSLAGYPMTNAAYQVARTELQTRSLITRDRGTKKITMHRLIQDAARAKMSAERFDTVFRVAVTLLSSVWPFEEVNRFCY